MSTEKDAGQSGKKGVVLVVAALVLIAGISYVVMGWFQPQERTQSRLALSAASVRTGTTTDETAHYRELLRQDNDQGAAEAEKNNTSFLASIPRGVDIPVENTDTGKTRQSGNDEKRTTRENNRTPPSQQRVNDKDRQERLKQLLARLRNTTPATLTVATVPGGESGGSGRSNGGQSQGIWHNWTSSLSSGNSIIPATLRSTDVTTPPVTIIPALTRVPAYIETAVDSDNTTSQVVANIPAGPWAGARLHAARITLVGDGVEINFTRMFWQGTEYKVNAWAQDQKTLQSSIASDVNHRYVSRIFLPAFLGGFGEAGSLFKSANTQILTNQYSTLASTAMPSGKVLAGVIGGGMAEKTGSVLQQDAAKLPATQVTVNRNETIAIQFVDGVYSTDAIKPGASRTTQNAQVTSESRQPTLAQLRARQKTEDESDE
ncbi:conjugal transfer protein TraO [Escherichia coli]|uniref:conjugal transfer protein TraO n=1 Tax=Escherichia coli TaxID=562 RepID=UPI001495CC99|nr:conjugal transfer protein TraO [Escherichia coli]EEJ6866053.1 conjugal transfer protein TraO [Salmonella enterica]EJA5373772.1 conjugal transfer protein TraO [Salmonella enterica subsp. enterica serovar Heidelberg]EGZ0388411.1 conjugal transfer protein TraO [Escherichia coli]EJA1440503.1 conjugal transfer protein TraO [Salmonella enterica]EKY8912313.1 conjugal transfer protein TraO [Escherichia coli]